MMLLIRGDFYLMVGRLILRFNFIKFFFVINLFFNDFWVWFGFGDNGKWIIVYLILILKMKFYFWLCLVYEIFYIDDVIFYCCLINMCFVVW